MRKTILTCLCNVVLLTSLCLPAEARVVIGLHPVAPLPENGQLTLEQLGEVLEATAKVTNKIRRFDNEASHNQPELPIINQALPGLNTSLDYRPVGRDKVETINLSFL